MGQKNTGFNHIQLISEGLRGTNSVPGHHIFNHLQVPHTQFTVQNGPIPLGIVGACLTLFAAAQPKKWGCTLAIRRWQGSADIRFRVRNRIFQIGVQIDLSVRIVCSELGILLNNPRIFAAILQFCEGNC